MNDSVLTHRIGSVQPSNTLEARLMRKMRLMASPGGNTPTPPVEEPKPPHKVKLVFEGGQYENLTIFDDGDGNDTVTTGSMTRTTMSSHFFYGAESGNHSDAEEEDNDSEQSDDSSTDENESTVSEDEVESTNHQSYHSLLESVQEVVEKATKVLLSDESLSVLTEPPKSKSLQQVSDDRYTIEEDNEDNDSETMQDKDLQVIHSTESQELISEVKSFSKQMENSEDDSDSDDDAQSLEEILDQNDIVIIDEVSSEEAMKSIDESNKRTFVHAFAPEVIVSISPVGSQQSNDSEEDEEQPEPDLYSKGLSEYSESLEDAPPPPPPPVLSQINTNKGLEVVIPPPPPPLAVLPEEDESMEEDEAPPPPPLLVDDIFREALKAKLAKQPTKAEGPAKGTKELPESASVFTSTTVGVSNLTKLTTPMMETTTNVHHCVSATCLACRKAEAEVVGSPRRMMSRPLAGTKWWEAPNNPEEESWISEKMQPFLDMVGLDQGAFQCGVLDEKESSSRCMRL